MASLRDLQGRFTKKSSKKRKVPMSNVVIDHNYAGSHVCEGEGLCGLPSCPLHNKAKLGSHVDRTGWKDGRRIVELDVLLSNLVACKFCGLGPIPLTYVNIVGEFRKGLGGYLYVKYQNPDCSEVNKVPYGKTHHVKQRGMPCFVVNTKLGTSMIDSLGGPDRVNNFLSTLNIKPINCRSLKAMENRAGLHVEKIAKHSTQKAANESFQMEMEEIAHEESLEAQKFMGNSIGDLGVYPLPGASPSICSLFSEESATEYDSDTCTSSTNEEETENVIDHDSVPFIGPLSRSSVSSVCLYLRNSRDGTCHSKE